MKPLIVHIAEIEISEATGMGRVAWHWRQECLRRGYEFVHIGPEAARAHRHKAFFPRSARKAYRQLGRRADLLLVHEPAGGAFVNGDSPTIIFSHGLERRYWNLYGHEARLRTRIIYPIWRLRGCDRAMRRGDALFLINKEDGAFAQSYYNRSSRDIFVFENGVEAAENDFTKQPDDRFVALFLGTWIERKGIKTLVQAARILHERSVAVHWLLAGTHCTREQILRNWPEHLWQQVEVVPSFHPSEESKLFASANVFVLPSFFEGQPLSLLQAMANGRCCIASACCGQKDIITHAQNGLLHATGDAAELATLVERCHKDVEFRERLARKAKESVSQRQWAKVSQATVDQMEKHMKGRFNGKHAQMY